MLVKLYEGNTGMLITDLFGRDYGDRNVLLEGVVPVEMHIKVLEKVGDEFINPVFGKPLGRLELEHIVSMGRPIALTGNFKLRVGMVEEDFIFRDI